MTGALTQQPLPLPACQLVSRASPCGSTHWQKLGYTCIALKKPLQMSAHARCPHTPYPMLEVTTAAPSPPDNLQCTFCLRAALSASFCLNASLRNQTARRVRYAGHLLYPLISQSSLSDELYTGTACKANSQQHHEHHFVTLMGGMHVCTRPLLLTTTSWICPTGNSWICPRWKAYQQSKTQAPACMLPAGCIMVSSHLQDATAAVA